MLPLENLQSIVNSGKWRCEVMAVCTTRRSLSFPKRSLICLHAIPCSLVCLHHASLCRPDATPRICDLRLAIILQIGSVHIARAALILHAPQAHSINFSSCDGRHCIGLHRSLTVRGRLRGFTKLVPVLLIVLSGENNIITGIQCFCGQEQNRGRTITY